MPRTCTCPYTPAEKALSQLRSTTASLQRATQHAQGAKRVLDGAFAELRRLIAAPPTGSAGGAADGAEGAQPHGEAPAA
jgi:hypothetical protein